MEARHDRLRIFLSIFLLLQCRMTTTVAGSAITSDRALEIAKRTLLEITDQHDFVIQEDRTVERPFGWVFFYVPRKYLASRDVRDLVPGNAPLVVHRRDGSVAHLATSIPPARAIEIYEKRWEDSQRSSTGLVE